MCQPELYDIYCANQYDAAAAACMQNMRSWCSAYLSVCYAARESNIHLY